jgi:short-subunit dehydrogenase
MCSIDRLSAGTRILITGASRGIGAETAVALATRGASLVLAARDRAALAGVAARVREAGAHAQVVCMDVTDDASVSAAAREVLAVGPLDVLINNAGGAAAQSRFLDHATDSCSRELELNYFGAQRVTRAFLPAMLARGRGTIVNVSSLLAAVPCPSMANYCGAKAALNAWSHALRGEVEASGVRVVVFMPSHTDTALGQSARFDGVYVLPVKYTAEQLVHAVGHTPRSMVTSPVFRSFVWLAGVFPGWAERRMAASTRALLNNPERRDDRADTGRAPTA